jgi:glycosyltransferase involved in cell wall biosynthesis
MSQNQIELTILMPCLNEAETLARCVSEAMDTLKTHKIVGEVLIADNGSTDGSQTIALSLGARIVHITEKGYGNALRGGIAAAQGRYILMGDSDASYDFTHADRFLIKLREGWDVVMGNRFIGNIEPNAMPWKNRYIGNPVLTGIGRLFFKCPVGDFHCGLRAFSKSCAERLNLKTNGMELASEMVIKATLFKERMTEVPTTLRPDGRSRPPHLRPWRDGWRHLRFMLLFSPRWLFLAPGIILMFFGLIVGMFLISGPIALGHIKLDVHSLMFSAVAILVGFQSVAFAVCSKVFAIQSELIPSDKDFNKWMRRINLEKGLIIGTFLIVTGLLLSLRAVELWQLKEFGPLQPGQLLRWVIPGSTMITLGCQTILVSFFLSILGLNLKK